MIQGNTCDCVHCELKSLFFNNVPEKEIGLLCNTKHEKFFRKGESIIQQGEPIQHFLYLKSGLVKLFRKGQGDKDQIIKIARPMDFISLLSVFSDNRFHYSVGALEDSYVCYVDLSVVKEMVFRNGQFAMDLLEKMSKTTDDLINITLEISRKNLRGRIAYVLLHFSKNIYKSSSFDLPVSRKEIAEFIEMTTENVIRILSEFRQDGLIRINGKNIEILDDAKLTKISELG